MFFIIFFVVTIFVLYKYLTYHFDYWDKVCVPNSRATVFFGNLPSTFTRKHHIAHDITNIYRKFKGKAPFAGFIQFRTPRLLILEPDMVKDVMIKYFNNFHDNEFSRMTSKELDPIFGRNPFMLRGEEWKEKRKEITPALSPSRLKSMFSNVHTVTKTFKSFVNNKIAKDPNFAFNAHEISSCYTCNVSSSCAFDVDALSFASDNPIIKNMGFKLFETKQMLMFFIMSMISPKLAKFLNIGIISKQTEKFFFKLMEDSMREREMKIVQSNDFLQYLISLRNEIKIDPVEITAHGIIFFTGGFITSSAAITHALYELGKNKNVQTKLRKLLSEKLDDSENILYEIIELPYLDQVFNETLRLHPPVVLTTRECTSPIELQSRNGEKVFVEKGLSVFISIYDLHHDPEYYENPESFIPERFDDGKIKEFKNRGVFVPFGSGPRGCLGQKFAAMQSKAIIAELVRNFEISINERTQEPVVMDPKEFLNLKKGGLWLNFKSIKNSSEKCKIS